MVENKLLPSVAHFGERRRGTLSESQQAAGGERDLAGSTLAVFSMCRGPPAGRSLAFQARQLGCRQAHSPACLTSVPSTLPRPILECESWDCSPSYRIPFLVCFLLPSSSHFLWVSFHGTPWSVPTEMQLSEINLSLTQFRPKQLLPTGEFHIVLRKSATNTNNNKICLYFRWLFPLGTPWWERALGRRRVCVGWK